MTAPTTTWLFAEGFTGSGFDTFFLLNNPADADTNAILTFFLDTGAVVAKQVTVAAHKPADRARGGLSRTGRTGICHQDHE